MSSQGGEPVSKSAAKKKKKAKKKAQGKDQAAADHTEANGSKEEPGQGDDDEQDEDEGKEPSRESSVPNHVHNEDTAHMPSSPPEPASSVEARDPPAQNGAQQSEPPMERQQAEDEEDTEQASTRQPSPSGNTSARLDAMQQERDKLRNEVTKLRQSLESLQSKHNEELSSVRSDLEQSNQSKDQAETQYRNLLGKVNTIRSQLGERLKQDAAELDEARARIEDLEKSNEEAQQKNQRLQEQVSTLNTRIEEQASEVESLRSRMSLSTTNWAKERDDLLSREAYIREEYEVAKQAMQDWEILATEERSRREVLKERVTDLEEQISSSREAYERIKNESETQNSTVDGLQRALRDLQEERKRELRELVEQSQAQVDELRKQAKLAEEGAAELKAQLETTQKELERALPFEKEVKEKNLLIGKLRHEAVILNDHLTKALRFLKRGRPEDNVDRQLVTNHFLHFLALDRSDPKKFQVLQLIAALLGWDESQREQAGLLRTGASGANSLSLPMSPFRRTPSTPTLGEFIPESSGGTSRESLAELWSEFLEREAEAGRSGASRRGSQAKSARSVSGASEGGLTGLPLRSGRPESPDIKRTDSGGGK